MYEKTKKTFGLSSSKKIIVAEGQLHSPEEFFQTLLKVILTLVILTK